MDISFQFNIVAYLKGEKNVFSDLLVYEENCIIHFVKFVIKVCNLITLKPRLPICNVKSKVKC